MKRLNLSRWNFIKWAGVVGLALVALCQKEACAQTALPVVGAIRWDAWQEGGTVQAAVETDLSPYHWHHRVPFFGRVTGSNSVSINGNTQTIMDQEIDYAANAGLGYWAFVIYPDNSGMSRALHLYLKSSRRDRIRFALPRPGNLGGHRFGGLEHAGRALRELFPEPHLSKGSRQPSAVLPVRENGRHDQVYQYCRSSHCLRPTSQRDH